MPCFPVRLKLSTRRRSTTQSLKKLEGIAVFLLSSLECDDWQELWRNGVYRACSMEVYFLFLCIAGSAEKRGLASMKSKILSTKPKMSEWGNIQVKFYAVVMEFFFVACVDFLVFAPMLNFCIQDLCLQKERSCNEKWQPCHSNERNQGKHNVSNFWLFAFKTWTPDEISKHKFSECADISKVPVPWSWTWTISQNASFLMDISN